MPYGIVLDLEIVMHSDTPKNADSAKHILIVDDDPYTRSALSAALRSCGYKVSVAMDCAEALPLINDSNCDSIDVAIVDISMPCMSGIHFIDEIKKSKPGLPLVIVSGFVDKSFVIELLNRGFTDVISQVRDNYDRVHYIAALMDAKNGSGNAQKESRDGGIDVTCRHD